MTFMRDTGASAREQMRHLTSTGDFDSALGAAAPFHEVAALCTLVHQRESVECTYHAPITRIHHTLR